eukprot:1147947-Pelagomonas_calceolata.AAC.5
MISEDDCGHPPNITIVEQAGKCLKALKRQRGWTAGYGSLLKPASKEEQQRVFTCRSSVQPVRAMRISQLSSGQLGADCPCGNVQETHL